MSQLIDFAVVTIFAREVLEGGIIIGEYRTIILRSNWDSSEITQQQALRAVTVAALAAALVAVIVCVAVAIPLAILSRDFDDTTASLIEGVSKVVAAICLLQLSLKMPQFFGLYYSAAQLKRVKNGEPIDDTTSSNGMSLRSIRFNVSWNIWREVAECGVFLIPFFLTGEGIEAIPLSAVAGTLVGSAMCGLIYYANRRFKSTVHLTVFTVALFLLLSTGLFSGGCHEFEVVHHSTAVVWSIDGDFWSSERLPMTLLKPFGYSDERTVLQIVLFWLWLLLGLTLHYCKYKKYRKLVRVDEEVTSKSPEFAPDASTKISPTSSYLENNNDGNEEAIHDVEEGSPRGGEQDRGDEQDRSVAGSIEVEA